MEMTHSPNTFGIRWGTGAFEVALHKLQVVFQDEAGRLQLASMICGNCVDTCIDFTTRRFSLLMRSGMSVDVRLGTGATSTRRNSSTRKRRSRPDGLERLSRLFTLERFHKGLSQREKCPASLP